MNTLIDRPGVVTKKHVLAHEIPRKSYDFLCLGFSRKFLGNPMIFYENRRK